MGKINISSNITLLIARLLTCAIFLVTGIWKFVDFKGVSEEMAAKGMIMIPFFLTAAAIIEIIGGLSLLVGYKTRLWTAILMLYLIPVTIIFHDFWNYIESQRYTQIIEFLKNMTIIGGLCDVRVAGPGRFSLDSLIGKQNNIKSG